METTSSKNEFICEILSSMCCDTESPKLVYSCIINPEQIQTFVNINKIGYEHYI